MTAELNAPATPLAAAVLALVVKLENFGSAVAAKIPKITITTTNSMMVKPDCCDFICMLLFTTVSLDNKARTKDRALDVLFN